MQGLEPAKLEKLLRLCTGKRRLAPDESIQIKVADVPGPGEESRNISFHTCFNQISVPRQLLPLPLEEDEEEDENKVTFQDALDLVLRAKWE